MWVKLLCVASVFCVVWCGSVPNYNSQGYDDRRSYSGEEYPTPFYELPCMSYGGICLQKNECPKGKLAEVSGLCPIQQDLGVECCFSVAASSTTCRSHGGECRDVSEQCPPDLTYSGASDCGKHQKCCVLVR